MCVHLKTLLVSKHENISPSGKTKRLRIEFSRKSPLFGTRIRKRESFESWRIRGSQVSQENRARYSNYPFIKEGGGTELSPATVQLLSRPHAGTFHASLRSVSSGLVFISTLPPLLLPYIYPCILPLFHRSSSSLFDHYASLTSEQVRPSTVVEAAERKVTTFLSSSFFLSFRARNKNTSASRK